MSLRVSEIYPSFQGEGPNTGKPTTFIRFAGCNLKCPGWPCDTPHAIDPKIFSKEQKFYTPQDLASDAAKQGPSNFCLTGGEVFMQSIDELQSLMHLLHNLHTHQEGRNTVEVFTNGTRPIPHNVRLLMNTVILDWKLPGSGESVPFISFEHLYETDMNLLGNLNQLRSQDAIKFTVKHHDDFQEARKRYRMLVSECLFRGAIYCGPVWGALEPQTLAQWILEDGLSWNLNIQTHKYIWEPEARRM